MLAILKAGGMDVLDHLKEELYHPDVLIDLKRIRSEGKPDPVSREGNTIRIEAWATLAQIAASPLIREKAPVVAQAVEKAATPQVRNVATAAGNLLQRPRCWYYRNDQFNCLKKGGATCYAVEGENKFHAIFGGGPCHIVHPSNLAPALMVCEATVHLVGGSRKSLPIEELFHLPDGGNVPDLSSRRRTPGATREQTEQEIQELQKRIVDLTKQIDQHQREVGDVATNSSTGRADKGVKSEHNLEPGEVITHITLKDSPMSGFYGIKEKQSFDWPLVFACVSLRGASKGGAIDSARVCAGAVAPVPWPLMKVEQQLAGKSMTDAAALQQAAAAAGDGASPMTDNQYKVRLLSVAVRRALLKAAGLNSEVPNEL